MLITDLHFVAQLDDFHRKTPSIYFHFPSGMLSLSSDIVASNFTQSLDRTYVFEGLISI